MGDKLERTGSFSGGRVRLFASIPARSRWRSHDPPTEAEIRSVHLPMDNVRRGFDLFFPQEQQDCSKQTPTDNDCPFTGPGERRQAERLVYRDECERCCLPSRCASLRADVFRNTRQVAQKCSDPSKGIGPQPAFGYRRIPCLLGRSAH